jgi:hypothetical protein
MPENSTVDLQALGREVVQQRFQHELRFVVQEKSRIQQIHSDNSQGLLLLAVLMIKHPHMDNDLAIFIARMGLELHTHPAMAFVGAVIVACRYSIGERKKGGGLPVAMDRSVLFHRYFSSGVSPNRNWQSYFGVGAGVGL